MTRLGKAMMLLVPAVALWPGAAALAAEGSPAVQATHAEVESIGTAGPGKIGELATLCVAPDNRLLVCDAQAEDVKAFDPSGKLLATWALPFAPSAICTAADGTVYVGGVGKLARLDKDGKVVKTAEVDEQVTVGEGGAAAGGPRGAGKPVGKASGMAVLGNELFVSFGVGWSMRSKAVIVRFDRDLGGARQIAGDLNGCCQRLDLTAVEDQKVLYVAENTRFRVLKMDREGKVLASWGDRSRAGVEGFGSCCNPMNLCFDGQGVLYTAESGLGRVKRYTPDGKFLSLVGEVGVTRFTQAGTLAASCSNIAVAVSPDGSRVFVQDVKTNGIRVLAAKK